MKENGEIKGDFLPLNMDGLILLVGLVDLEYSCLSDQIN